MTRQSDTSHGAGMSRPVKDDAIPSQRVRAIVRLLGEVAALNGGHEEKKRTLMDGLCVLIGADFWAWALATKFEPGEQPVYTAITSGGFSPEQFPKLLVAFEHPDLATLTAPLAREVDAEGRHITRLRSRRLLFGLRCQPSVAAGGRRSTTHQLPPCRERLRQRDRDLPAL
jgi:hypothetical protein